MISSAQDVHRIHIETNTNTNIKCKAKINRDGKAYEHQVAMLALKVIWRVIWQQIEPIKG